MRDFLVMRDNEYLVAYVEMPVGSGQYQPVYSIYKYDAARIPTRAQARHIMNRLKMKGEDWKIVSFNWLTGTVRPA